MKQLHKQSSVNHRRDEDNPVSQTSLYSPKALKHPRFLPRSINYIFKEQHLLFILVGIAIGSTFFILQPSLSQITPTETHLVIPILHSWGITNRDSTSGKNNNGFGKVGRIPVGIGRRRLRIVVTGVAGFVGSHSLDKLMARK